VGGQSYPGAIVSGSAAAGWRHPGAGRERLSEQVAAYRVWEL